MAGGELRQSGLSTVPELMASAADGLASVLELASVSEMTPGKPNYASD